MSSHAPNQRAWSVHLVQLFGYLQSQVGWVPLDKVRKAIDSKYADNRKLEACRYLGLLERDGTNIKLTDAGREFASGDTSRQQPVMRAALHNQALYSQTLEWIHFGRRAEPTRTEVAVYWDDKYQDLLDGAKNAAVTDAVIFFFRVCDAAGLGKFISAGNNRPTALLRADLPAIEAWMALPTTTQHAGADGSPSPRTPSQTGTGDLGSTPVAGVRTPPSGTREIIASAGPNIHVNVEIHIAADATADTVEEIFKNMRRYILDDGS